MVAEEEKAAKKKQGDIDRETERLRKMYGVTPIPQQQPPRPTPNSSSSLQPQRPPRPAMGSNGLYTQPSASASTVMMSDGNGNSSSLNVGGGRPAKKKSFFGLRSLSDDAGQTLVNCALAGGSKRGLWDAELIAVTSERR